MSSNLCINHVAICDFVNPTASEIDIRKKISVNEDKKYTATFGYRF